MKKLFITIFLILLSSRSWAMIAFVNYSKGVGTSTPSSTLSTSAISTTSGNLIVAAIEIGGNNTVSSVTDTAGNTYIQGTSCYIYSMTNGFGFDIWYAYNITGNASNVLTVNYSGSHSFNVIAEAQYSGELTSSAPFQTCATGFANASSSVTSASFSPTIANGVNVAIGKDGSGGASFTAGTNYTARESTDFILEDYLSAPSGAQTASYTISTTDGIGISVVSFAPAPAPAGTLTFGGTVKVGGTDNF